MPVDGINLNIKSQYTIAQLGQTAEDGNERIRNIFAQLFKDLDSLQKITQEKQDKEKIVELRKDRTKVMNLINAGKYDEAMEIVQKMQGEITAIVDNLPPGEAKDNLKRDLEKDIKGLKDEINKKMNKTNDGGTKLAENNGLDKLYA